MSTRRTLERGRLENPSDKDQLTRFYVSFTRNDQPSIETTGTSNSLGSKKVEQEIGKSKQGPTSVQRPGRHEVETPFTFLLHLLCVTRNSVAGPSPCVAKMVK